MYEDIDEAHRIITRRVHNATTKYGYECRGGYKPRDGYLYMRDYQKRKYLLDSVETFAGMLCKILEGEGIHSFYNRSKVLRISPNCRDYYYWFDMSHPHIRVPIEGIGNVAVVFATWGPSYYIHSDPRFGIPTDVTNPWRRGHHHSTKAMVDNLKLMIEDVARYRRCDGCYYSDGYGIQCGLGVEILPGTCTQWIGRPTNSQ